MATRFIDKEHGASLTTAIANDTAGTRKVQDLPDAVGFVFDKVDRRFKYNDAGTIRSLGSAAVVSATGTTALTASLHAGRTVVVNAVAGGTFTLPAATGSGDKYRVVLGTALTSAAVIVTALAGDIFYGLAIVEDSGDTSASDATIHATASDTIVFTDAFTGGGGEIGDFFEAEDIGTDKWAVKASISNVADSTVSPWSAS